MMLMTRDEFRNAVFERDNHKCVICGDPAQDAHHILERRLFSDGGYYLDNGASVCGPCHIKAEETTYTAQTIRDSALIKNVILPDHLYHDQVYDKWGNPILPNGTRLKGELFDDFSVQKILKQGGKLDLFIKYVKYPRTFHVPHSPGISNDDRAHDTLEHFEDKRVIVHLKMDGENTSMYNDHLHARSLDSRNHPSRKWAKILHARVMGDIPEGWRICAENLYAEHSIHYPNLDAYVQAFSIWDQHNICLSWNETQEWFELLDIPQVEVLYDGIFSVDMLTDIEKTLNYDLDEGYVMRRADAFHYVEFKKWVAKYVRSGHVHHKDGHWANRKIIPNELKNEHDK